MKAGGIAVAINMFQLDPSPGIIGKTALLTLLNLSDREIAAQESILVSIALDLLSSTNEVLLIYAAGILCNASCNNSPNKLDVINTQGITLATNKILRYITYSI